MTRLPIPSIDQAPLAARPLLADLRQRSLTPGRPLNFQSQMAEAPAVLAGYLGIRRALEDHSTFDLRTRTAIMLTVTSCTHATYAEALHAILGARSGWTLN